MKAKCIQINQPIREDVMFDIVTWDTGAMTLHSGWSDLVSHDKNGKQVTNKMSYNTKFMGLKG